MARTGARSVCLSVASVPFFGGGGRFGRSWGMRQSLGAPVPTRLCWGARRARAVLAVAPSNAMRAACGELAVALLIVAMKTYRKHVLGRAMIPRLWRMGGRQRLHSKSGCLQTLLPSRLQGSSGRLQEPLRGFLQTRETAKFRAGIAEVPAPIDSRRHCATPRASLHHIRLATSPCVT